MVRSHKNKIKKNKKREQALKNAQAFHLQSGREMVWGKKAELECKIFSSFNRF